MADKTIGSLPAATTVDDSSLWVAENQGQAQKVTGAQIKGFAQESVQQYVSQAQQAAEEALEAVSQIGTAVDDTEANAQAAQAARAAIEDMGVAGTTLGPGQDATVTKTVDPSSGAVTLTFGIPQGPRGEPGPQGNPGASIQKIERTSGTGAPGTTDTYTITLTDGRTSTFTVYNGANGEGAGDMVAAIYDPTGKETDIYAYVDGKIAALPTPDVSAQIQEHNTSPDAHQDIRDAINVKPEELYVYDGSSKGLGLKALNTQIGYIMLGDTKFLQVTNAVAYGNLVKFLSNNGTISGLKDPEKSGDAASKGYVDSSKVSKVADATAGNLATLTSDGGIQDSGKSIGSVMGVTCVDATSSDGIAYTASVEGMTSIPDGAVISIVPNMDAADHEHINLNVNGLGAKYLQPMEIGKFAPLSGGGVSYSKMLSRGRAYLLQYNESVDVWVILSSPSGSVYYMSGTFGGTVMAKSGSQPESFSCIRNIKLQSSTPSTVPSGELVGVYE